jgi:two-component sensor histidine kinase
MISINRYRCGSIILKLLAALCMVAAVHTAKAQTKESQKTIGLLASKKLAEDSMKLYYRAASQAMQEDDLTNAAVYAHKALQLGKKINSHGGMAVSYFMIANGFLLKEQNDSARYYALKSIEEYDIYGKKGTYYTYALNTIAAYYLDKGDAANALVYGHRQMDAAIEVKDTVSISNSYTMLSAIYELLDNYKKSIEYSEKALELNRLSGQLYNRPVVLNNLALLYFHNKQVKEALHLLYEAVDVSKEIELERNYASSLMFIGQCHTLLGNSDSAIYYLNKAEEIILPQQIPQSTIELWNLYAEAYKGQQQYDKALSYVDRSMAESKAHKLVQLSNAAALSRAGIYAEMGNYREAYKYYVGYRNQNDSLTGLELQQTIEELQTQYETAQKDKEISQQQQLNALLKNESLLKDQRLKNEILLKLALEEKADFATRQLVQDSVLRAALNRENELKKQQLVQAHQLNAGLAEENELRTMALKGQQRVSIILLAGLAVLLALGVWIFSLYRRQKLANSTIQQQSNKLTFLMKELHHRVKNNLQIISSLLSLQSFRIKDTVAARAVKDGQQRIEAMSLIHQRLYTRDDITEINIKEFITDIVDSLQRAYGFNNRHFKVQLDIENELMNVDEAIPLSLIINELISNAFKYAYEGVAQPQLTIKLSKDTQGMQLLVADNGVGIDMDKWNAKGASFGKDLVQTFIKQLNGYLSIAVEQGTRFHITFPTPAH